MVNGQRDRRMYAYIEVERRKGLSLRRAYAKAAKRGGFGALSARTVESAYVKERRRQRQRRRPLALIAVERNAQFLAAVAERNAQVLAAAIRPHAELFRHLR